MRLIALTLFNPLKGTEQLKHHPRWIVTFLILSVFGVVSFALMHPSLVQSTLQHLPASATNEDKQVVIESLNNELPAKLVFYPVRLFLGWSTFALLLLYISKAFGPMEPVRFNQIFSLEVHAEATSVIGQLVTAVITSVSDKGIPITPPFSLAALGQGQSFVIGSLLTSLNIFTLWYIIVLFTGIHVICRFNKAKSLGIVFMAWVLTVMFNLGTIQMLRDQLHLLL